MTAELSLKIAVCESMDFNRFLKSNKIGVSKLFRNECEQKDSSNLKTFLKLILNPEKPIDKEAIEWCNCLIAGGLHPKDFANEVKKFNHSTTCGLVWTPNFVAYRCRTCGISPCMSLCKDCFKNGNHESHDYNWFYSLSGGACDCGDSSVMKESGFCDRHGLHATSNKPSPSNGLMIMAEIVLPQMIIRLIQHFRELSSEKNLYRELEAVDVVEDFIKLLLDLNDMGALMGKVITNVLINPSIYKNSFDLSNGDDKSRSFMKDNIQLYNEALLKLPNPIFSFEKDYPNHLSPIFEMYLSHQTFLEELVFWTVRYKFHQQLVCFLLKILPNHDYKMNLMKAFVLHYSRIALILESSNEPDLLSNRIVHVSVQLFSNQKLALAMACEHYLLPVIVLSLKHLLSKVLVLSRNNHKVVNCNERIMKDHCYWPLVSDLSNILSHKSVAVKFLNDTKLLEIWFDILMMFQEMNLNRKETREHVEFESNTYYAAFSAELEISAYPMWSVASHLKDENLREKTLQVINLCLMSLKKWFTDADIRIDTDVRDQVSFHLPLHRYLAIFLSYAVHYQNYKLEELLPPAEMLELIAIHPIMIQVAVHEIMYGEWVRNGVQIKGQAVSYIRSNFSMSMVDADFYLMQIICTKINVRNFYDHLITKFNLSHFINLLPYRVFFHPNILMEEETLRSRMFEGLLTFLATLINLRTFLKPNQSDITRLEIVAWLCISNQTHSNLIDSMPDRYSCLENVDFEKTLKEVANFKVRDVEQNGTMHSGTFEPKDEIWENEFDPIHVLLRVKSRKEFQSALDRFTNFCKSKKKFDKTKTPWPPYRTPKPCNPLYDDPRKILKYKFLHGLLFIALYKSVHTYLPEQILSLVVYFLEMIVDYCEPELEQNDAADCSSFETNEKPNRNVFNMNMTSFYKSDCIFVNLKTIIEDVMGNNQFLETDVSNSGIGEGSSEGAATEHEQYPFVVFEESMEQSETEESQDVSMAPVIDNLSSENESVEMAEASLHDAEDLNQLTVAEMSDPTTMLAHQQQLPKKIRKTAFRICDNKKIIDESMITLLLKCHSKLSGVTDSFRFNDETHFIDYSSSIGDGAFYIGRLFEKICTKDPSSRKFVNDARAKLWPYKSSDDGHDQILEEAKEKEERKKRVIERQQKLMAEFAKKQKQFLETVLPESGDDNDEGYKDKASTSKGPNSKKEQEESYDCVICNVSTSSTDHKLMGLVVLMQPTNIMGHQTLMSGGESSEPNWSNSLPCSDDELEQFKISRAWNFRKKCNNLMMKCNGMFRSNTNAAESNFAWYNTVHVQTCGHYLHLKCFQLYMETLLMHQRNQNLSVELCEYYCPLCRQLSNAVFPVLPKNLNYNITFSKNTMKSCEDISMHISSVINNFPIYQNFNNYKDIIKSVLRSIYANQRNHNELGMFITIEPFKIVSMIRTTIEIELIVRGSNLVDQSRHSINSKSNLPKRNYIVPLHETLSVCLKHVNLKEFGLAELWDQLIGKKIENTPNVSVFARDPVAVLYEILMQLPSVFSLSYFSVVVQTIFYLLRIQLLIQLSYNFSNNERLQLVAMSECSVGSDDARFVTTLLTQLQFVIRFLSNQNFYTAGEDINDLSTFRSNQQLLVVIVEQMKALSLPFLRTASLLKMHYFQKDLPQIATDGEEFQCLADYLEINVLESNRYAVSSTMPLHQVWLSHMCSIYSSESVQNLLTDMHALWSPPKLLYLPNEYEKIFTYYHDKKCSKCKTVPLETAICLICGDIVCLKQDCCKTGGICEAAYHTYGCSSYMGIFLVIKSTYIIVIRGARACLWGSIYLDAYAEEDRDLKRGKPLFLSQERYKLLEQQWITHRFDHLKKNWVWHRNQV